MPANVRTHLGKVAIVVREMLLLRGNQAQVLAEKSAIGWFD